ncbi:TPA: hypothetical protein O9466_002655 [Staphylococcus aureus]|nr:hypothetical protein [Staphylococcus aureus]HDD0325713.1 hypothetical protein [Staphylococcus aureus]HDD0484647.1 hypothetical protein [Staphylococcus aureus]HDD0598592.1 hypothetical protein [Staphylococcus aureus]
MKKTINLNYYKIGLASLAVATSYIFCQHEVNAASKVEELNSPVKSPSAIIKDESIDVVANQSQNAREKTEKNTEDSKTIQKNEEKTKNFVTINSINPGDTKITGTTLPNYDILLSIDEKTVSPPKNEKGEYEYVVADEQGRFEYPLGKQRIVYNQKIDVISSDPEFIEEDQEQEITDATSSFTTPRYAKAYEIPSEQLKEEDGQHRILIEPIVSNSRVIKGHTSLNGKVALSVNNKLINLDTNESQSNEMTRISGYDGIWKHIDTKGYFEFDFKRKAYQEILNLKENDTVSLIFSPKDEEEALKPLIFNVKVTELENIDSAITEYSKSNVKSVKVLSDIEEELYIDELYGFSRPFERSKENFNLDQNSSKEIKGKTKFANAVVKVYSDLMGDREFPDLQVDEKGVFSFNAFESGYLLFNGENLSFVVVEPITGEILSQLVTKKIDVYETPEEKQEREFEERLESTPAYYKLCGDQIVGFNLNDMPITWFNAIP